MLSLEACTYESQRLEFVKAPHRPPRSFSLFARNVTARASSGQGKYSPEELQGLLEALWTTIQALLAQRGINVDEQMQKLFNISLTD